jgi:membrane-bound metal-dependent hydrolase YbcI (DUF457 family)
MFKWIREWFMLSAIIVLGMVTVFMLWAIWPLLSVRLSPEMMNTLNVEGIFAILLLITVLVGFGKLLRGEQR